jgi:hypothetical protein
MCEGTEREEEGGRARASLILVLSDTGQND